MIDLFTWATPNGERVQIALEELELDYRLHPIDLGAGEQRRPEFLRINPYGKIPAIVDQNGPGGDPVTIFESAAILIYLGDKAGRLIAEDPVERSETLQWLMVSIGGIGPMMGQLAHFTKQAPEPIPYAVEYYLTEVERLCGVVEGRLEGRDHLVGDYSIADIAAFPWLRRLANLGVDTSEFPRIRAWIEAISARPAVQRGLTVPCGEQN